jgi:hypothetical protein
LIELYKREEEEEEQQQVVTIIYIVTKFEDSKYNIDTNGINQIMTKLK